MSRNPDTTPGDPSTRPASGGACSGSSRARRSRVEGRRSGTTGFPVGLHKTEVIVPTSAPFIDERGALQRLIDASFGSALVVTSVKGAVRGNHYHKTDYHYSWLQRGGLVYYHRPVGSSEPPKQWVIKPGQLFFTPPGYEHAMHFTEESVMIVFARNNRQMEHYEEDTVRIPSLIP